MMIEVLGMIEVLVLEMIEVLEMKEVVVGMIEELTIATGLKKGLVVKALIGLIGIVMTTVKGMTTVLRDIVMTATTKETGNTIDTAVNAAKNTAKIVTAEMIAVIDIIVVVVTEEEAVQLKSLLIAFCV